MKRPAVFLDKDGTLVEDVPFNVDPTRIRLAERAGQALRRLRDLEFKLVVVSNQSGVALGYFQPEALTAVERCVRRLLAAEEVLLDGFYYCPHHERGAVAEYSRACACRKPQPGMLLRAAEELRIDLGRSWMLGDILDDIEAGRRAGCRAILIDNGGETEWQKDSPWRQPDHVAANLSDAAAHIATCRAQVEDSPYGDPCHAGPA